VTSAALRETMPVTPEFRAFVLDQLHRILPNVRDRAMFGGVGIYAGELFFALIADDVLYLKVDDSNRAAFEAVGSEPFRPYGPDGEVMQYYELPADILEEADQLRTWAHAALDVARRKRKKQR
jgi:DNA transformation protein